MVIAGVKGVGPTGTQLCLLRGCYDITIAVSFLETSEAVI